MSGSRTSVPDTSCAPCSVGSTTVKLIGTFRSSIANAAAKLYAWKLDLSKTSPFSRISAAVNGRAVTSVMSRRSMTSMTVLSECRAGRPHRC